MNPEELLAALEGIQPTEMRSRAAVADALRRRTASLGPSARVVEGTGPSLAPGMTPTENEIRPDYTMPTGWGARKALKDSYRINQGHELRPGVREKMYPLPDRFYDQDHRLAPNISDKSHVIAGGQGQDAMMGDNGSDEFQAIMEAIKQTNPEDLFNAIEAPPAEEGTEISPQAKPAEETAPRAETSKSPSGYGPSLEFLGDTEKERTATQIQEKYLQQGIDPTTLHPIERSIAEALMGVTEGEQRNSIFQYEGEIADYIMRFVSDQGSDWFAESFTGNSPYVLKLPGNLGNMVVSDKRQVYDMAKRMFIEAVLRPVSGAVINYREEEPVYKEKFFPTPFDGQIVKEQKALARRAALDARRNQASPLYVPPELEKYVSEAIRAWGYDETGRRVYGGGGEGGGGGDDGWATLPSGKRYRIIK